jgi:hypothetical protein
VAGLVGKSRDPLFVMPAEAGISGGGRGRVRQVLRLVLLPPAAPAFGFPAKYYFAGAPAPGRRVGVKDGRRTADARFPWLEASMCDRRGSAPSSAAGKAAFGPGRLRRPGRCPQALPLHSVQPVAAVLIGWPYRPLEVSLQHRPPSPSTRCRHEAADLAGGYPLRVVRIAPLHDAGITVRQT